LTIENEPEILLVQYQCNEEQEIGFVIFLEHPLLELLKVVENYHIQVHFDTQQLSIVQLSISKRKK
jgi:hypothetical protein